MAERTGFHLIAVNVGVNNVHAGNTGEILVENVGVNTPHSRNAGQVVAVNVGAKVDHAKDGHHLIAENVDETLTPTPHLWFLRPTTGKEGSQFRVIGTGFGPDQATVAGECRLDGDLCPVSTWGQGTPSAGDSEINPVTGVVTIPHGEIKVQVPTPGESGLVVVSTDR